MAGDKDKERISGWRRPFLVLYLGQGLSLLSSSVAQFSIIWWLTVETGSALVLTLASAAGLLPQAVIGLFAGAVIDRTDRKKVMMVADLVVAGASLCLALCFLFGLRSLVAVYVVLFIRALGETFHRPALQAAIPQLVPADQLTKTAGLGQLVSSACSLAGPMLGAWLMSVSSLEYVMLVDVGCAISAVGILARITFPHLIRPVDQPAGIFRDLGQGLRAFTENRTLVRLSLPLLVTTILFVPIGTLLPLMVKDFFFGLAWHNGVAQAMFSVGMLLSALLIGLTGGFSRVFLMIAGSAGLLGVCTIVLGLLTAQQFWLFCGLMLLIGASGMGFTVPFTAFVQRTVPSHNLGKVLALITSVMSIAAPIGMFVAGPLVRLFGLRIWLAISGSCMAVMGLAIFLLVGRQERAAAGHDDL